MPNNPIESVTTLTFDIFGTVLDLTGSLEGPTGELLRELGSDLTGAEFYPQWRARQRIEQFQDSLIMLGHSGYLETCRRALVYSLRANDIEFDPKRIHRFMDVWQDLDPYPDSVLGLQRLERNYRLVALSNGEPDYLRHLASNQIKFDFDAVISVEEGGAFKPHPAVYRSAARILNASPPEIMMVAAHSFDIMGARACGFRGAYVNRYSLPYEDTTQYTPDIVVSDFNQLADVLLTENQP
ncbi:MAG: haloacid dehalogenase type II [Dehalococcoidia bacterium]|nr:haloacid dehalogenase type II [Dehalococcoidia bacterium]